MGSFLTCQVLFETKTLAVQSKAIQSCQLLLSGPTFAKEHSCSAMQKAKTGIWQKCNCQAKDQAIQALAGMFCLDINAWRQRSSKSTTKGWSMSACLCGAAAQSQNVLQQQMKAASAAASQYKQQAQETGRDFDSFKQQVCVHGTSNSHSFVRIDKTACLVVATQACLAFKALTLTCCDCKAGVPAQGDNTGRQPACKSGQHTVVTWGQHQL